MRLLPHHSLAALLAAVALTACGGGNTTVATPAPAPAPTPAPSPSPAPDQGCTAANTHCAPQP